MASTETHKNKICLALDVDTLNEVQHFVTLLKDHVGVFKIGKQLFTRFGPEVVHLVHKHGGQVFLDLKFHDIPNTVMQAARACADLGVKIFNVHASGGRQMMEAALEGVSKSSHKPTVLAVTVLTSLSQTQLNEELHVAGTLADHVVRLAKLSEQAGIHGVVCSPQEISLIRKSCNQGFIILTPGVRPVWSSKNDQVRVMTPNQAVDAGADFIVVGRPVTQSKDPVEAVLKLFE